MTPERMAELRARSARITAAGIAPDDEIDLCDAYYCVAAVPELLDENARLTAHIEHAAGQYLKDLDMIKTNSLDIEQMRFAVLDYDREQNEKRDTARRAGYAEKRKNAPLVPCGMYGCTILRNELDVMCPSCVNDMYDDPDAYK
jgi:hypothetical protein